MIEEEPPTVKMGEIFGRYELVERIATGGMAEIFRAASPSISGFKKTVALKRILPHLSTDAEFVSLFISEAKLAVRLNHSNIVQVIDFGRVRDCYYLAMELVDGRDLTEVLVKQSTRGVNLPIEVGCYILSEALLGLEYAHTLAGDDGDPLGIVHRDVSPHNILVSYDGEVRLTDFGIAKARSRMSLTRPGTLLGKFAYMSPEQARGQDVDPRSDVYAAGVTLYETLTGRRLFFCEDPGQTLAKVRNPQIPEPSLHNPVITRELDQIVLKALAPKPQDRFRSARAFASALQSHLHDLVDGFNDSHVARLMKQLFADEVGDERFAMAAARPAPPSQRISVPQALVDAARPPEDPVLTELSRRLETEPNLWWVVQLGERLEKVERPYDAVRAFRLAAAKFAQNGMLVQAVAAAVRVREILGWSDELREEVARLPSLRGVDNRRLADALPHFGHDAIGALLRKVLEASKPSGMAMLMESAIFSQLSQAELSNLVEILSLTRAMPGKAIVEEGEPGDALYIIIRGRVVIYCQSFHGEKVYLSSLSDGDCVGEFSFFTRQRRVATVETVDETQLFEIKHADLERVFADFPNLTGALLRFYKERVVESLLAKSEIFGVLDARVRADVARRLTLERFGRDELIIGEGDDSDGFYLIKAGEVEVFSERRGFVFLSKLSATDFFGEMAGLDGHPRSASVRALGDVETLRLSATDLAALAEQHPEMTDVLRQRITQREAERVRLLTAGGQLV